MSDDQTIDMQAIDGLRELSPDAGGEFLRELIEIYLQDTPQRIAELVDALSKKDGPAFTRAAHTIKGSSSNFGATKLTKVAHELEMQGKSDDLSASSVSCAKLSEEYALVAEALSKISQGG
jgi:HPt (histidine-containing phosphotransfer) domain-containing protein